MNSKLRDKVVLVAMILAVIWCIPAAGQVIKGSISGTVTDPQSAVVSGATVKATNSDTGATYTTTSDSSGLFRFNLIPAGSYKVEISAQGFKTSLDNNVLVSAGSDRSLGSVKLAVGEASTTVEVAAAAPLVDTTQAQVTNTFSGVTLSTFAGVQENEGLDNLALFVPGVTSSRDNGFSNTNGGSGFQVNGIRGRNNDQEIDGQNNNDNSVGGPGLFVSDTEFVQQYVLITNQFGPEYGRNAGSVVNIITKSGTNSWHGSLFGTENNSALNSMSNQQKQFEVNADGSALTEPTRLNNEFGGFTIGGPMVKNKMFIFGGFDEQIISTIANFHSDDLTPTPAGLAALNGCFPASHALQAWNKFGPFGISGGNPVAVGVPDNPSLQGSPRHFVLLNIDGCDNVQFGGVSRFLSAPFHGFDTVLRNDIQFGGSDSLTARYLFNRGNNFNNDFGDAAAGYPVNVPALSQAILLSETHNFSPRMVNEARVSFNRLNVDFGGNSINTVPTANGVDQAVTRVTFRFQSNFATPGSAQDPNVFPVLPFLPIGAATNLPQSRIVNTWQAQDNWNLVLGRHQLKAGVNWTYQRSPNIFLPTIDGAFRFDCWDNCIGNGGLISNNPDRVQVASGTPSLDFREYDTFVYGGDDWKISQNLTLNLGITWTYYGQPANLFNSITTARESNAATQLWNPALPLSVRTFPLFPAPKNSFGPSAGFAYSPQWGGFLTGHGKTTIRGGFRMLYDPPFYNIYLNMSSSSPAVFLQSFSTATSPAAGSFGLPTVPTGPNVRSELSGSLQRQAFDPRSFADTTMAPNFGPDKVNAWSFGFEREITKNSAFEARYAGNRAYDLFQSVNANPLVAPLAANFPNLVPSGITPCPATQLLVGPGQSANSDTLGKGREFCNEGVVRSRNNSGYSYYNGLQLEFRANNLFKQLTLRTGYTWSKTLDNVSEIFSTFAGGNSNAFAQDPFNTGKGEYSFSGLDIPHQWTLLFTEQLPFFKEQHGFMGHLLGGWAISADYVLASGQRYTPSQVFIAEFSAPNYFDANFYNNFNGGAETARPFIGSMSAPSTAVGIFAADACNVFGVGCALTPNTLLSLNAINNPAGVTLTTVTKNDVRYIANGGEAETIFGTPFGNAPRNSAVDAISNIANVSFIKRLKLTERTSFEFHATMLNAFNHFNFSSVDPFLEDAGLHTAGTGFGDPTTTNANGRTILFGGKISF